MSARGAAARPARTGAHLAHWRAGKPAPPLEYALAGTPCEHVVEGAFCFYPRGVARRFPDDAWLSDNAAEAYMGEPIRDAHGRSIGLIAACFRRPLSPESRHEQALFRLLAARAALEIERRRNQRTIEQHAALLEGVLEHIPDALLVLDPHLRVSVANTAAESLFERTKHQLACTAIATLIPGVDRTLRKQRADSAARLSLSCEALLPDGSRLPVAVRLGWFDLDGTEYPIITVRDVSEQRAAEARIRQLNRTYALLSETNQAIVRSESPEQLLEEACRIAVEVGGFRLAWIGLRNPADRLEIAAHAGADQTTLALLRRFVEGEKPDCVFTYEALTGGRRSYTLDITEDDRTAAWRAAALELGYRCIASLPLRVGGQVAGTFNLYADAPGFFDEEELQLLDELALDIALGLELHERERQRQAAQRALRESEERFRLLIENAPDMIHVLDNQGRMRFRSPSAKQILGYESSERIGRPTFDLVHPDDLPRLREALEAVARNPATPVEIEVRMRHRDGSWRWIASTGRSLPEQDPAGFIVINSRDVTKTRLLEEQLRHAQKMEAIGRLAGGVAHDFNNLLTAILGQLDLCGEHARAEQPALRRGLREIREHALRAADLTRQLLLFSRKQVIQPQTLDLNEVVRAVSSLLSRLIGEDITLKIELHPEPIPIEADRGMIEQVLMNLAVNARDAMPEGGRLEIGTSIHTIEPLARYTPALDPGRYAVLEVADSGCGIPQRDLERIFEPFFTTKEPGKGTGLGLATTFSIVEQHRGGIEVQSKAGAGTRFRVALPLAESKGSELNAMAETEPEATGTAHQTTVLVVEDEPAVRSIIQRVLRRAGIDVLAAADAAQALALWNEHRQRIGLLLTDLVMPGGMSGEQLAARIGEDDPQLPVLFVTGYSESWAGRTTTLEPHQRLLQKPFTPKQLLAAIRELLP